LQDVPKQGLRAFQPARVAPGAARNHLVPDGAAVYAHYLNRQQHAAALERAAVRAAGAPSEGEEAAKARLRDARMFKKLRALTLVRTSLRLPNLSSSA
jgi:ribosomal protein L9